jgi:tetratricopeptide (TPR) repeat protein
LEELIVSFAQKVNKLAMENYEQESDKEFKEHEKMLNKAVSLLMLPEIEKHMLDVTQLKKLKILSFNNLSCIYKKKRKFGVALRAISYAVKLEEELLKAQVAQEKYDIVPTYLNKAAIFSEMKKHNEALEIVLKAKTHIEDIEKELIVQIEQTSEESERKRLLEKRYYGMYMKMIIFYNMAAEKEHLRMRQEAVEYYKQSKQVATIIDNQLMISKLTRIIDDLLQQ